MYPSRPFPMAILILAVLAVVPLCAATYYVSPQGDDAHSGLKPDAASALRTLQCGVDKLRAGDTLLIRGGVYRETVTFHHSGTAGRPLTVKPYQSEKVTLTGCDPVTGWTLYDAQKGIWKAPMPWTLGIGRNQAFAGGQVLIEARYPNKPAEGLGMYVSGLSPLWPTFGEFSIPRETVKEQPGRIVSKLLDGQPDDYWKGAVYYGVHYEGWAAQGGVVESSKSGEINVGDRTRTWWFGSAYGGGYAHEEGRGMLVGHLNALDQPGEWHWQDNTLYLIPTTGKQPVGIEAKRRQLAFDLSGQEHISLSGLTVTAASARLQDSAYCTFDHCNFSYLTHYTKHYDIGQIENGRDTIKSGETGIFVGGHDNAFLSCSVRLSAGAGFYLRGYHHTIHNCLIDEVSYTAHYLNAITDAVSDFPDYENFLYGGHVITYNTMRNAGRHFFNFYGNGPSTASRTRSSMDYMATLFAHNHLYNGMLQTKDAGFLTSYYASGGTLNGLNSQVCYNVMHDCYDLAAMRWGVLGIVYLDAGSCDVDLYNNLLWAAPGSLQRGLWYNTMCVDVHERDNLFHPEFTRTSAELTPKDFPGGKPFRFGHDFANVPPLPQWPQLEKQRLAAQAEGLQDGSVLRLGEVDFSRGWQSGVLRFASAEKDLNSDKSARQAPRHQKVTDPLIMEVSTNDGLQEKIRRQWTFMYGVADGAWIRFNQMPLGEGYRRFRVIYGNDQPTARTVEVRLDTVDGPLVGTVNLPQTDKSRGGRIQIYAEATGTIAPTATGTHDVFLVFRSPDDKPVGEFEYFRFEQYRGAIPLQKNEVKFELRVGSRDGEKIGEFYPRYTGGADNAKDLVASLEPAPGKQPLFLVVRSAYPGAIGSVQWLSLEKAKQPVDWAGVTNVPPLAVKGKPIYPQPTNRPCAKPADQFPKPRAATASGAPRPIARAEALAKPPVVDGKLDEWPTGEAKRTLMLAEDPYGAKTVVPASQAWIGYDAQALYLALRNPVNSASDLQKKSHTWGQVDGVEVAIQDAYAKKAGSILTLYGYPDGKFTSEDHGGATAAEVVRLEKSVTFKTALAGKEWTCEWRIPFAACGFTPQTAPLLAFNLGVRKMSPEGWAIWRGTGAATYEVGNGGLLVFPQEILATPLPQDKLELHLEAQAEGAVVADAEGRVSLWKDQSGKGRDAKQANTANAPLLVADGLNGHPALRFEEKRATRLELPDLSEKQIPATAIAVVSNPVAGAEVNHDPRILTASDGQGFDYQVGIALTVPGLETGGPRVMTGFYPNAWAKVVRVGCFSPNPQTFFTGEIAEILLYSRTLKPAEADLIRGYLAAKWGL